MKISLVVPTYNRLESLKRVLSGLELQQDVSLADFEVIVISDGSTDETNAFLQTVNTTLQLVPVLQQNGGAAAARNNGIRQAQGELILFLDDDVFPTPRLIAEHLATHQAQGREVAVLGPMLTPADFDMSPWVQWEQAMLEKQYSAMREQKWEPTARQFFTGNTSLPRHCLLEQGGFDTQFRRAEDVELAYRLAAAGLKFVYHEKAVGYHYAHRSFASWFDIPYSYGVNDVIFAQQKGQLWLLTAIWQEFYQRNAGIQGLVRLCLARPFLTQACTKLLLKAAQAGHTQHRPDFANKAYSGVYNLRYYQGVADQYGGRKKFFSELINRRTPPNNIAPAENPLAQSTLS
ncbi:MAG: glycosyltransferase [Anaerolineae bacterium]|jgi:GT2 family glycosyltransferase|nr:glycosyltransferase [Anaerolineae bacterium]